MNQVNNENKIALHQASFRDPSGFIFKYKGSIYRQVNLIYRRHYDHMMETSLYSALRRRNWLVAHEEVDHPFKTEDTYKILKPCKIQYVSYP